MQLKTDKHIAYINRTNKTPSNKLLKMVEMYLAREKKNAFLYSFKKKKCDTVLDASMRYVKQINFEKKKQQQRFIKKFLNIIVLTRSNFKRYSFENNTLLQIISMILIKQVPNITAF